MSEKLISLQQARDLIPTVDGKRPAISTIWRWCLKGYNGVLLEHTRYGRRVFTTKEALQGFSDGITMQLTKPKPLPSATISKKKISRRAEAAIRELEKLGY